jgi:hypothetical protein
MTHFSNGWVTLISGILGDKRSSFLDTNESLRAFIKLCWDYDYLPNKLNLA